MRIIVVNVNTTESMTAGIATWTTHSCTTFFADCEP